MTVLVYMFLYANVSDKNLFNLFVALSEKSNLKGYLQPKPCESYVRMYLSECNAKKPRINIDRKNNGVTPL